MSPAAAIRPLCMTIDLTPATEQLAALVCATADDALGAPTPCPAYTVGDLIDHIGGVALAFTMAATKDTVGMPDQAAAGDASRLEPGFRDRIAADLAALSTAWRDPSAWTGTTKAGPFEMPGEVAAMVAIDEVVVHGWDLAVATGQRFAADDATLEAARAFLAMFSGPGTEEQRGDAFGPVVPVPADAPLLDQVLAMSGRDPGWRPS
jgi:uncharacterized protein (TIGR03086 family)